MNRRNFLSLMGASPAMAVALAGCGAGPVRAQGLLATADLADTAQPIWAAWKGGYLQADGRVVDRLQHDASHSEGQGYGLVLASEFNDENTVRRILDWTEANLAVRGDGLLAWRYLPNEANPVADLNNASDGDLFFAWGLVRAARKFGNRQYLSRAVQSAQSLARTCIVANPANPEQMIFLPGAQGFVHDDRVVFNPSYIMPMAMREVAAATGVAELAQAAQSGDAILAQLAQNGVVPDWIEAKPDGLQPATGFSNNAGYEAMRVPLYLVWSGLNRHPAVLQMARVYDRTVRPGTPVPTVIEPTSGVVIESSNDPGYRALAGLITCAATPSQIGSDMPAFDPSQPYYPATLQLFAMIAANQVTPECVPI